MAVDILGWPDSRHKQKTIYLAMSHASRRVTCIWTTFSWEATKAHCGNSWVRYSWHSLSTQIQCFIYTCQMAFSSERSFCQGPASLNLNDEIPMFRKLFSLIAHASYDNGIQSCWQPFLSNSICLLQTLIGLLHSHSKDIHLSAINGCKPQLVKHALMSWKTPKQTLKKGISISGCSCDALLVILLFKLYFLRSNSRINTVKILQWKHN